MLPSIEKVGDLSGTRPLSYFPNLDDRLDLQSPSGEALIVGHDDYGLVSSLVTSESQPIPEISHCLPFEPADQATHPDNSPSYPSDLFYTSLNYSTPAVTPSSLQGQASSQSARHTDIDYSGNTTSQEFSAASDPEGKDSPNNAALLYDVSSTDFTDSPVAQPLEQSAFQLRNNENNRAGIARAENLDLGCKETTSPPRPVREQGPLSCPVCGKGYSQRHELK